MQEEAVCATHGLQGGVYLIARGPAQGRCRHECDDAEGERPEEAGTS